DEKRRDLPRTALDERQVLALDRGESPDPRRNEDTDTRRLLRRERQRRIVHGELRGRDRVLDEDVHLLDILLLDVRERIEVLDLSRDPGRELGGIKLRDRGHAA